MFNIIYAHTCYCLTKCCVPNVLFWSSCFVFNNLTYYVDIMSIIFCTAINWNANEWTLKKQKHVSCWILQHNFAFFTEIYPIRWCWTQNLIDLLQKGFSLIKPDTAVKHTGLCIQCLCTILNWKVLYKCLYAYIPVHTDISAYIHTYTHLHLTKWQNITQRHVMVTCEKMIWVLEVQ